MSPDAISVAELPAASDIAEVPRLPVGWAWTTLGETLPLEYGKALPERLRDSTGKVAVYGSSGRVGSHAAAMVAGPTLIVGRKGSAGAVFYCNEDCWPIDTVYYTKPKGVIDLRYGFHFLKWRALGRLDQSTAIPSLSRDIYSDVAIPVAPLPEQRRIVARIDELFAEIADGEAALERARQGLDTWRRALLKAAVTGELTREWREANRPTETGADLLARIRAERGASAPRSSRGRRVTSTNCLETSSLPTLPEGWAWTTLGDLSSLITSGSRGWKQYYAANGSVFIRAQNLKTDRLELDDVAYVELPSATEGLRTRVSRDDILVTITGANVTRSAQVDLDLPEAYVNQHVGLVRLADPPLSDFVFLVLVCPTHGRKQLKAAAYGAGKPGLNLNDLASVLVPLPSLEEQRVITTRVQEALSEAENAFAIIERGRPQAATLRQSILKAAFEGQLAPQNPADEPASALLDQLRDGHSSNGAQRRRARATADFFHPSLPGLSPQSVDPRIEPAGDE